MNKKFRAYVAGFGSGKTWAGCASLCKHFYEFPKVNAGYFAPTYGQIRDIFYPTVEECASDWGLKTKVNIGNKEVHFYSGANYRGTTICRSMDNPASIVGFKIGHGLVDELDTLKPDKAKEAWRKIIARMRYNIEGLRNGIDVTTTPEGYRFTYEQFVKEPSKNPSISALYGIIRASTYDNEANLPEDYIPSLIASYPQQLIEAYLNGQFVNLTSGAVYPEFDRKLNASNEVVQPGDVLHIGMDFNVLKMAAVIYVLRGNVPHAVDELVGVRDTPTMCQLIKQRYGNHAIYVYPDASGQSTSSKSASLSDHSIIRQSGFTVRVSSRNPSIKDRVNAVNAKIQNGEGERSLFVNVARCPSFTEALEQQVYDQFGMPDKSAGQDHVNDAGGYFIAYQYPIEKPNLKPFIKMPY